VIPLAIDGYCGLGGWTEGLLAAGYRPVGVDIKRHQYDSNRYPAQMVQQDMLTVHGSQFKDAALLLFSPPCENYSYLAMPWSRSTDPNNSKAAKALRKKWETEGPDNRLFDACFRIQREAIEATRKNCPRCCNHPGTRYCCSVCSGDGSVTRYIPMIVENVRGAQPWVGKSKANYGSFHLWGDVGMVGDRIVIQHAGNMHTLRVPCTSRVGKGHDGTKIGGDWFSDPNSTCQKHGSRSSARKAASAMIAKIPEPLARFVATSFYPISLAYVREIM
jgi:hypothetical protein